MAEFGLFKVSKIEIGVAEVSIAEIGVALQSHLVRLSFGGDV